jgi:c-di-GMP-binding flagellar brake protein YcgR
MVDEKRERRRLERIFFSIEDEIRGTFIFSDIQTELDLLTANVVNLSKGGLALTLSKEKGKNIGIGDRVILTQVKGKKELEFLTNIEAEIKWILDNPSLEFIGFGCEFLNISESMKNAIQRLIDSWYRDKSEGHATGQHRKP